MNCMMQKIDSHVYVVGHVRYANIFVPAFIVDSKSFFKARIVGTRLDSLDPSDERWKMYRSK